MNEGITLQQLEAEKKKLEAQLKIVLDYIVAGLGAMLSQECQKKTARIRQVSRGVYDLK